MIDVDKFLRGYIVCALWSSNDNDRDPEGHGIPLDENYDVDDLADETRAKMLEDCEAFIQANDADLHIYCLEITCDPTQGSPEDYAGHDFWLTRNGHGCGFWDRGLRNLGVRLTEACRPYGEVHLWGNQADGKVYQD